MWPPEVIALFKNLSTYADELEWLMPWNALLNTCFPLKEGFAVAPVVELEKQRVDQVEFLRRSYVIKQFLEANGKRESCDIFFVEVKRPKYLGSRLYRREVDSLMRRRFYEIENIPSTLHGIAAFGTRVAFYHVDKASGRMSPAPAEDDVNIVKDTCPESRWETDILTGDGYDTFMMRVNEAKELGKQELQLRVMGS